MQFRWVIGIVLWTILSGPVFAPPQSGPRVKSQPTAAAVKPAVLSHGR